MGFQGMYKKGLIGENNHLKINMIGKESYILKRKHLFSEHYDISNGVFEIYPRVLDVADDFLKYNGTVGSISVKTTSSNALFSNIIIDDITVNITGINNDNNRLINIDPPTELSTPISFSNINDNFFDRLEFRPIPKIITVLDISTNLYYKVKTLLHQENNQDTQYFQFERLNFFDQSILESDMKNNQKDGVQHYKTTTNSTENVDFNVVEDNTYHFDMSDESNYGSRLRFFSDLECKNELVRNKKITFINFNDIIFDDFETVAEYSTNIDPGKPGA